MDCLMPVLDLSPTEIEYVKTHWPDDTSYEDAYTRTLEANNKRLKKIENELALDNTGNS
jgi:hypothetical protein